MNVKRFVYASTLVFLLGQVLGYLIHGILLAPAYQATEKLWRPQAEVVSNMWIMWVTGLITSVLFTYIFVKGYEGKGVKEGLRFGFLIGVFMTLPAAYDTYAMMPIPYSMALGSFLYGTIGWMFMGALAATVYRPKS
jgi:hypothetical protein